MQRVLVPVDFSPATTPLLREAAALARAFDAELCLLHVAAPDPEFVGYEAGPESVRDQVADELRDERRSLEELASGLREAGIRVRSRFVRGATVDAILDEADREEVDWIALGSHGHGGLLRTLLGSVSEGVLHRARRPLLIVPAPEPE